MINTMFREIVCKVIRGIFLTIICSKDVNGGLKHIQDQFMKFLEDKIGF